MQNRYLATHPEGGIGLLWCSPELTLSAHPQEGRLLYELDYCPCIYICSKELNIMSTNSFVVVFVVVCFLICFSLAAEKIKQIWFCAILTAGLRGLNTSFLSSGFFAAFSRRWDGEPSDLDDAVRFRDEKERDTWASECGPRGRPAHLAMITSCWSCPLVSHAHGQGSLHTQVWTPGFWPFLRTLDCHTALIRVHNLLHYINDTEGISANLLLRVGEDNQYRWQHWWNLRWEEWVQSSVWMFS